MQGTHRAQGMDKAGRKRPGGVRGILAAGIVMTAFAVAPVWRAQAQEVYGRLDSFTGERVDIDTEGSAEQTVSSRIWITDSMYYDTEKRLYGYSVGDESVYATVGDGMIVRDKVAVTIPENMGATLYWEGHSGAFAGGELETPGSYTLEIAANGDTTQLFSFMIVNGISNQVSPDSPQ